MVQPGLRRIAPRDSGGRGAVRLPVIVCNPADDDGFCAAAEAALRERPVSTGALEAVLRTRYPRTVVRAREISNEAITVWYVYRDGSWTRPGAASTEGVA